MAWICNIVLLLLAMGFVLLICIIQVFKTFWRTSVGPLYPCFGLLVTSALGFKASFRIMSGTTPADHLAAELFRSTYILTANKGSLKKVKLVLILVYNVLSVMFCDT